MIDFYINHEKNAGFINQPLSFAPVTAVFPSRLVGCAGLSSWLIEWLVWLAVLRSVQGVATSGNSEMSAVALWGPEQQCSMTWCSQSHHYSFEMQFWRLMGYTELRKREECFHWVWRANDWETWHLVKFTPAHCWVCVKIVEHWGESFLKRHILKNHKMERS